MLPQMQFLNLPKIDAAIQDSRANEMQNAIYRVKMAALQKEQDDQQALQGLWQGAGGDSAKAMDAMMRDPRFYGKAVEMQTKQEELSGKRATTRKTNVDADKDSLSVIGQSVASLIGRPEITHQDVVRTLQDVQNQGHNVAGLYSQIPGDPAKLRPWLMSMASAGAPVKDTLERYTPKVDGVNTGGAYQFNDVNPITNPSIVGQSLQMTATPGEVMTDKRTREEGAANRSVTMRGQNLNDARAKEANAAASLSQPFEVSGPDGAPILVQQDKRTSQLIPVQGFGPKGKDGTEGEKTASGYFSRMAAAENIINDVASKDKGAQKPGFIEQTIPEGMIVNSMRSDARQQYRQAQEDWVRAKLRKESGAVIGEEEMAREIATYFPMKGDSEAVIAQKANARQVAIGGMKQSAGRAAKEPEQPTGKPRTGDRLDGYMFLGGDPADPKRWKKVSE